MVDARVPPTLTSLELSRSAERIIAAAPALLAATTLLVGCERPGARGAAREGHASVVGHGAEIPQPLRRERRALEGGVRRHGPRAGH